MRNTNTINKIVTCITLTAIALGSIGCSSSPRVYYLGDKAYAKNPETGKMMSWEYKASEGRGYEESSTGSELGDVVCGILNCVVN